MGDLQPLIGNPYNGYINPYYWIDDHPLLYGNNGSLDPSTYGKTEHLFGDPIYQPALGATFWRSSPDQLVIYQNDIHEVFLCIFCHQFSWSLHLFTLRCHPLNFECLFLHVIKGMLDEFDIFVWIWLKLYFLHILPVGKSPFSIGNASSYSFMVGFHSHGVILGRGLSKKNMFESFLSNLNLGTKAVGKMVKIAM